MRIQESPKLYQTVDFVPQQHLHRKPEIPHTAVWRFFKSCLPSNASGRFTRLRLKLEFYIRAPFRKRVNFLEGVSSRLDLKNRHTAVWGIFDFLCKATTHCLLSLIQQQIQKARERRNALAGF
jgi:hypothetical protein